MSNRKGFRGYICARMEMGRSVPQNVQQMVMREYCKSRNMAFLLSATEYRMEGCTLMLDAVLDELDHLEGIVMYSLYLFPQDKEKRLNMYRKLFDKGCSLHCAAESIVIKDWDDALRLEDIWIVHETISKQQSSMLDYLKRWDAHAGA